MNKKQEYANAKKTTIKKWEGVLKLCEEARSASIPRCTYCIVTTHDGLCRTCPANTVCMSEVHLSATHALNEAVRHVETLVKSIHTIKEGE